MLLLPQTEEERGKILSKGAYMGGPIYNPIDRSPRGVKALVGDIIAHPTLLISVPDQIPPLQKPCFSGIKGIKMYNGR